MTEVSHIKNAWKTFKSYSGKTAARSSREQTRTAVAEDVKTINYISPSVPTFLIKYLNHCFRMRVQVHCMHWLGVLSHIVAKTDGSS